MKLSPYIQDLLSKHCSHPIHIPADCEYLALDIESQTGVHIGATTLKRLFGFANDERQPHVSTLDAIARYLGFADWQALSQVDTEGNSGFEATDNEVRSIDLKPGAKVEIQYLPNRIIIFEYLGENKYQVADSQQSKLHAGDEVEIQNFILNHPLFIATVVRNGVNMGQFTAGKISGLSSIKLL